MVREDRTKYGLQDKTRKDNIGHQIGEKDNSSKRNTILGQYEKKDRDQGKGSAKCSARTRAGQYVSKGSRTILAKDKPRQGSRRHHKQDKTTRKEATKTQHNTIQYNLRHDRSGKKQES